jgi:hypothetical protein
VGPALVMGRRIIRRVEPEPLPEPTVAYVSDITLELKVTVNSAVVYGEVVVPEAGRYRLSRFGWHKCDRLRDVVLWPAAKAETVLVATHVRKLWADAFAEAGWEPRPVDATGEEQNSDIQKTRPRCQNNRPGTRRGRMAQMRLWHALAEETVS